MKNQQGFGIIILLLIVTGIMVFGTLAAGAAVLLGKAPECPTQGSSSARSEKEIGDTLEQGSVNITDGEATTLAQGYIGGKVDEARVCFTEGLGHVSGKMNLGSVSPSFYVSAGVDLSGSVPKATNLSIQLGSLPNISFIVWRKLPYTICLDSLIDIIIKKLISIQLIDIIIYLFNFNR